MKIRAIAALFLLIFTSQLLYSQETAVPAPYRPDEFPQWTLDLRRAEVVTVGSFPLSFMLTALVYDITYYAIDSGDYGAIFGSHRDQDDITNLLLISGGVSLAVGLTDFIIHRVKLSKERKAAQERDEQRRDNSQPSRVGEAEN